MSSLKSRAKQLPGVYRFYRALKAAYNAARSSPSRFLHDVPAGHYYSALPDFKYIQANRHKLFDRSKKNLPGVDLREAQQIALLNDLSAFYAEIPFLENPSDSFRYYYNNDYFDYGDAVVLYSMLRHFRPRNVIEVGSGFSSAVMLDTNDRFADGGIRLTFIEPYPERLLSLLKPEDATRHRILRDTVQNVDVGVFQSLESGDILFIDSSHVAKIGSDVTYLITEILPRLKSGVVIHIHDVMWPFEYHEHWLKRGIAWNEAYFVRAFLEFNHAFEILLYNSFIGEFHLDALREKLPLAAKNPGGSLWLRKVA